jgi:sugar phosphate isomerase/epimerase
MTRRNFLFAAASIAPFASSAAAQSGPMPMGFNTYCLRALRWTDRQLLDYAAEQKHDAIFLQDSLDPRTKDPAHWAEVKAWAAERQLHLETGGGGIMPRTPDAFQSSVDNILYNAKRAKAMGSPIIRCVLAGNRAALPPGPAEQHMATAVRLLRAVKSQVVDAGLKIAIEIHKDFQAWEHRTIIEEAGKDFVGTYMDTGNPVFVLEHPMTTLETMAPYILTLHLRDSIIYEHPRGVAVQWVPLGEGVVDFKEIMEAARRLCPNVYVYIKPITGRPPEVIPYLEESYWKSYPKARASELARFLALARRGRPYEGTMVIEDLPGRPTPDAFKSALEYQQKEHVERSVAYGRKTLGLGVRWRG